MLSCHFFFLLSSIRTILLAAGANEELHFHLFKLPHAEDELPCHNFVTKMPYRFVQYQRYFHTAGFCTFKKFTKIPCAVSGAGTPYYHQGFRSCSAKTLF